MSSAATAPAVTIEDAIERIGFGRFQRRLLGVCGVTWAADAAEIFLIAFALPGFREEFGLSAAQGGLVVSATFLGMLVGAWCWGALADRIGRRAGFQITIAIFAIAGLASAFGANAGGGS
jgi:putative MFS transporter